MFGDQPFATLPIAALAVDVRGESMVMNIGSEVFILVAGNEAVWQPRIGTEAAMTMTIGNEI